MSTTSSIGTYDSLFDDDGGTLDGICFDLDVHQVVSFEGKTSNFSPWCKSSQLSCCSLCRPRVISEAGTNDPCTNCPPHVFAGNDPSGGTRTNDSLLLSSGFLASGNNTTSSSNCECLSDPFELPIKSITIPRSCVYFAAGCSSNISPTILPVDLLCHMFQFLDVASLCHVRACNTDLCDAVSNDNKGWTERCNCLWSRKANVCSAARDLLAKSNMVNSEKTSIQKCSAMEAYIVSITDAANRKEITVEELCFDETSSNNEGNIWSFRFKESAGNDWTSWDPWWLEQEARKLVFLRDGTILQASPPGFGHFITTHNGTRLFDVFSERTAQSDGAEAPAPRIEMKWRFVSHSLDLVRRPKGAYVRISVGGRDVPTHVVRRSPNGSWGFILESCWSMYASCDMAPHALPSSNIRRSVRRTRNENRWVDVEESDSEDDNELQRERMRNVRRRIALFEEENAMTQDGYTQWREALLYNLGAVMLPESFQFSSG